MPKKGFMFDNELDQYLADKLESLLEPDTIRQALEAFVFLDEATAGRHRAMAAFLLGYLYSEFITYYELVKRRGPRQVEQQAFVDWLSQAVVPLIEPSLTDYEKRKDLR